MRDWRTDPRWVRPDDPPVDVLCGELRSAGISAEQAELLDAAADRAGRWWPGADSLPAQVIHGDLAPSNVLADPDTGLVTGLLDFELAVPASGYRTSWPRCTTPRRSPCRIGHVTRRLSARLRLGQSPGARRGSGAARTAHRSLARLRTLANLQWRAGIGNIGEVIGHVGRLEATTRWLAANGDAFLSVAATANAGSWLQGAE